MKACVRCTAPFDETTLGRPWDKCGPCTMGGGAHAALSRFGAAPAFGLLRATPDLVQWVVPGPPLSVNRVHRMGFVRGKRIMYFTAQGKAYKVSVGAHALAALGRVHWDRTRRYTLELVLYFDRASADSDNPLKVIKDALQGVLWDNDNQVLQDHTRKEIDKAAPRFVATVRACP